LIYKLKKNTMKLSKLILALSISTVLIASCKKSSPAPEPEPTPTPTPAPTTPVTLNASISGTAATGTFLSWSTSGPYKSVSWNIGGNNSFMFSTSKALAGTYTMNKNSNNGLYLWYNGKSFATTSGTINITQIDTATDKHIKRLKATFSYLTDTTTNSFYNVTSGSIDWTEQ